MAEQEINVFLRLKDQLTAGMEKTRASIQKAQVETKEFSQHMRTLSRDLSQASASLAFMGASITGPMLLAFKNASKYSEDVHNSVNKLNNAFGQIQLTIATNLIPIVDKFTNFINSITTAFNKLTPETQKFVIQGIFLSGVVLLISSLFLKLASIAVRLIGLITKAGGAFSAFSVAHPILLGIALTMALLIGLTQMLGDKNISALGKIQLGWNMFSIGALKALKVLAQVAEMQHRIFMAGFGAEVFKKIADDTQKEIDRIQANMQKIFETGQATGFLGMVDEVKKALADLNKYIKDMPVPDFDTLMQSYMQSQRNALEQLRAQWQAWQDEKTADDLRRLDAEQQMLSSSFDAQRNYYNKLSQLQNESVYKNQDALNSATSLLETLRSYQFNVWKSVFDFINMGLQKLSSGFAQAVSAIVTGSKKASEAWKDFGKEMITAIVEFIAQLLIQSLIALVLAKLIQMFVTNIANQIALAWMPAAIAASIATFGAAAVVGLGAVGGAMAGGMSMLKGVQLTAQTTGETLQQAGGGFTTLQEGGIVTKPTFALIGERGPEAVIPLNDNRNMGIGSIYIENASFRSDQDVEEVFMELSTMLEKRRRAKI